VDDEGPRLLKVPFVDFLEDEGPGFFKVPRAGFLDDEGKRLLAALSADLGGFDLSLSFLPDRSDARAFMALRRAGWPGSLDLLTGTLRASSALCIFSSLQNPSFQLKREVLAKGLNCSAARAMSR
jgi:hypothetical protein